jgi:hypothetical protein
MKAKTLCSTLIVLGMLAMAPLELSAKTLGMVVDNSNFSVIVFIDFHQSCLTDKPA